MVAQPPDPSLFDLAPGQVKFLVFAFVFRSVQHIGCCLKHLFCHFCHLCPCSTFGLVFRPLLLLKNVAEISWLWNPLTRFAEWLYYDEDSIKESQFDAAGVMDFFDKYVELQCFAEKYQSDNLEQDISGNHSGEHVYRHADRETVLRQPRPSLV